MLLKVSKVSYLASLPEDRMNLEMLDDMGGREGKWGQECDKEWE